MERNDGTPKHSQMGVFLRFFFPAHLLGVRSRRIVVSFLGMKEFHMVQARLATIRWTDIFPLRHFQRSLETHHVTIL